MMHCKKITYYLGIVLIGLSIYSGILILWSLAKPWEELVWNNKAIVVNATIAMHQIGTAYGLGNDEGDDGILYVGYVSVTYNGNWAQLRVVPDNPSRDAVEQSLENLFAINTTIVLYYDSKQPSNPHLGPKSIVKFLTWLLFEIMLFVAITAVVVIIIYRDYSVYMLTYGPDETIRLYNPEDISAGRYY
jgi:hypothetical protein